MSEKIEIRGKLRCISVLLSGNATSATISIQNIQIICCARDIVRSYFSEVTELRSEIGSWKPIPGNVLRSCVGAAAVLTKPQNILISCNILLDLIIIFLVEIEQSLIKVLTDAG